MSGDWSEVEKDTLRRLWPDRSVSLSMIAAALPGRSRNSIAGMRGRLGLESRKSAPPPGQPDRPKNKAAKPNGSIVEEHDAGTVTGRGRLSGLSGPGPGIGMADATRNRDCMWPLWGDRERPTFRVCGHRTHPGHQYCPYHVRQSQRKPAAASHRPWTKLESNKALQLVSAGVPWPKIANVLSRTPGEIKEHAESHGVEYGASKKGAAA